LEVGYIIHLFSLLTLTDNEEAATNKCMRKICVNWFFFCCNRS